MSRPGPFAALVLCSCAGAAWSSNGQGGSMLALRAEQPLVETRLNGQGPFHFMVDTGAGQSMMTPQVAQRLGLTQGQGVTVGGAFTAEQGRAALVQTVETGGLTVEQVPFFVGELPDRGWDGILGYDFLKSLRVSIRYRAHSVTFERPAPAPAPDGGA